MPKPPNIILITSDQQRRDSLAAYGATVTRTPATDRLAAEGVVCDRAYCTNPVCTPARASLFSGRHVTRHGAWNVGTVTPEDTVMLAHRLATAGYRTHNVGKLHFKPAGSDEGTSEETSKGWRRRFPAWTGPYYGFQSVELSIGHTEYGIAGHYGAWVEAQVGGEAGMSAVNALSRPAGSVGDFGGEAWDWALPTRLHNSTWVAERAQAFLRERDHAQPFFLAVGFQDPHHPHCLPLDFAERVDPARVPLPRFTAGELDDKPPHFLAAHHGRLKESGCTGAYKMGGQGRGYDYGAVSTADARLGRAYYYSMVNLMEQQLAHLLDTLDAEGLTENTIVIFTTDHGELLGDHGLWLKGPFHYEELVRVPLLLRWPAGLPAGSRAAGLLSHVDIVPTLLAAAGQPLTAELDGHNALPWLRGEAPSPRQDAIVECIDDPAVLRLKTIITETRKLTFYHGQDYGELYDLEADPGEVTNRWNVPAYAADREQLLRRLLDHAEPLERRASRLSYA